MARVLHRNLRADHTTSADPEVPKVDMPRSGFKKSHLGCNRCKVRKVKCDETHPRCNACTRLNVDCIYDRFVPKSKRDPVLHQQTTAARAQAQPHSQSQTEWSSQNNYFSATERNESHLQEIRLFHHFTVYTSYSFSPASDVWSVAGPQLAVQKPYLLDAMLAFSALHLSRLDPSERNLENVSHEYLSRAVRGQHHSINHIRDVMDAEALYLTSNLIGLDTLANLNQRPAGDPLQPLCNWLQIATGARTVYQACAMYQDTSSLIASAFVTTPDLLNTAALFAAENRKHLTQILDFGADFENMAPNDRTAYEEALSYVGAIYTAFYDDEDALLVCRRVLALPSIVPARFLELAKEHRPRALVIVAYAFAAFKLVKRNDLWWCEGVVETQLGIIYDHVPPGWRKQLGDPMRHAGLDTAIEETTLAAQLDAKGPAPVPVVEPQPRLSPMAAPPPAPT